MDNKPIISEIDPENAPDDIKEIIKSHLAEGYKLTGEKRTLLHNGPAFNAVEGGSYAVAKELESFIGRRAAIFFEFAVSEENDCIVCMTYYRNLFKKSGIDIANLEYTPKEELLVEYGRAIGRDPKNIPDDLFLRLKAEFSEEEIVVITAMGVMMLANNFFNDILRVTPDKLIG
ncbi:MAG: hypothetical protein K6G22_04120 [Lachnospiraceae bacterium]|nr:hypothetical protein [Lachnospiraceae bacterium]